MGADRFIYNGYKYAWEDKGHDFFVFTEKDNLGQKLEETKPDLFFASFECLKIPQDTDVVKEYKKKDVKIFMGLNPYFDKDPLRLAILKDPDFADIYYGNYNPKGMKNFELIIGKAYHLISLAADKNLYFPTPPEKKYECDIAFVGANLPRKKEIFKRRLLPLTKKYKVKIFGEGWTRQDKYFWYFLTRLGKKLGTDYFYNLRLKKELSLEDERKIYSSAKICLNFHEKLEGGEYISDINERTFKIPASGGFQIVDFIPLIKDHFEIDKEIVMPKSDEEYFEKIDYYLTHEKERKEIQKKGTAKVLRDHTYHNRVEQAISIYNTL